MTAGSILTCLTLSVLPGAVVGQPADFETTVPSIQRSIAELGFELEDIKIILGSHAHGDHMEADALVKQLTDGAVMAMAEDVPALFKMRPGGKEHPIDRVLHELGPQGAREPKSPPVTSRHSDAG